METFRNSHSAFRNRRALAPLELVIAMPMLMMVMALMIVFGNAAYWKVRGLSVARNAAWSNRWPRAGFDEPTPNPWQPGQYSRRTKADLDVLDDPQLQHPVVRGPLRNGFQVDDTLLDPSRGIMEGHAEAKVQPQMMPKLKAFEYSLEQPLIDDKFQHPQMGVPANVHRRIPFIYTLPKADAGVSQAWVSAALAVMNSPLKPDLAVLDHDDEVYAYYGYYPDFHPRLLRFCSLDSQSAWDNQTRQLIGRIKGRQRPRVAGLAERLASFWIGMYQARVNELESQIANSQDPTGNVEAQGQIGQLKSQIDTLKEFRTRARQQPDSADGPVPPLAMLSAGAGSVSEFTPTATHRDPHELPLRLLPASLLKLMAPIEQACCGQATPIDELLELLDSGLDLEELP